jgi:hypothetical protein
MFNNEKILIKSEKELIDYICHMNKDQMPAINVKQIDNNKYKDIDWFELKNYLTFIVSTEYNFSN